MFSKKKKKPQISLPSNFEYRVHTAFDKREGRYIGLPPQWVSIVGNNQILKSTNRPLPLVDPSEITPTEILDLKTIVRPHLNNNKVPDDLLQTTTTTVPTNGIVLPKTSHVARSNSLRSSSPQRIRRDIRGNANFPPSVPEEPSVPQLSNFHRGGDISGGYASKPQPQQAAATEWNRHSSASSGNLQQKLPSTTVNVSSGSNLFFGDQSKQMYPNDNRISSNLNDNSAISPINVHTDLPTPFFR